MGDEKKRVASQNGLEPKKDDNSDIEFILNDIGGTFNKFQIYNHCTYLFSLAVAGVVIMTYVFSALNLEYRYKWIENWSLDGKAQNERYLYGLEFKLDDRIYCRCQIAECDSPNGSPYDVTWISTAIPFTNSKPEKCHRYTANDPIPAIDDFTDSTSVCPRDIFNYSSIERCEQNGLVYQTDEVSIVNEVCI